MSSISLDGPCDDKAEPRLQNSVWGKIRTEHAVYNQLQGNLDAEEKLQTQCTMRRPMSIDVSEVFKCKHSFHAHFK